MGIPGLTTFVQENFSGWERRKIRGKVVIDGYSLCFSLHEQYRIDWKNGGQYAEFREVITLFMKQLRDSGIHPIVVFDGIDYKGVKTAETFRRRRETVRKIHSCFVHGQPNVGSVLPTLSLEVFRETLEQCRVQLYVVDGEADPETVALANHYKCPVVSFDSDYYLFNVSAGYIPITRLTWEAAPVTGEVYLIKNFATQFKLAENMHFLIPAIIGNDFLKPVAHPQLRDEIRRCTRRMSSSQGINVRGLIEFLSSFSSLEDLLKQILTLPSGEAIKSALLSNFAMSQEMYTTEDDAVTEDSLMCMTLLRFGDGSELPEWVLRQYREGYFTASLMEIAVVGRSFLRIVPDDPKQETALAVSRPIRMAIYGILSPHLQSVCVTEVVRYQVDLREETVEACSVVEGKQLPSLDAMQDLNSKTRLQVFCSVMGVCVETIVRFDRPWHLVVAVSCYWARTTSPSKKLIKALVLCLIESSSSHAEHKRYRLDRDLAALHQYSKWQCVYLDAMKLNNLLLNPVVFVSPASLFDGNLIMFYAQRRDIGSFVKRVSNPRLYSHLQAVIEAALLPEDPAKSSSRPPRQHRDHHDKHAGVPQKHSSASASGNRFAMLTLDNNSSSDDASGD